MRRSPALLSILGLAAAGLALRGVVGRHMDRVTHMLDERERGALRRPTSRDMPMLRRDPGTGAWRPDAPRLEGDA